LNYRKSFLNTVAILLFYLGVPKLLNGIANWLQRNENEDGKLVFPFVKRRWCGNVQILVYHRVNDDRDPFFSGTPSDVFRKQMDYLVSNFNILSLEDAVEGLARKDVPDNAIVVTFDDGYRDNYLNAFPILNNLSIPATIFLATDAIGSGRMLWHDRVFSAFRQTRVPFLDGFGARSKQYPLSTIHDKVVALEEFLNFIRARTDRERASWIDCLIETLGVSDSREVSGLMLSWDEVRMMHEGGISFGSHSVTHPILSKLPTDRIRDEIQESKLVIEQELHTPVRTFAYPNGREEDYNEITKSLLREAGYTCAVTTQFGNNESGCDLFELRRATPWDRDIYAFGLRLNYYKLRY